MTAPEARVRAALEELGTALIELARAESTESPHPVPLTVSIDEAAALLGIKRTALYGLMARGEVVTHKIGRRRLVSVASLRHLVEGNHSDDTNATALPTAMAPVEEMQRVYPAPRPPTG